jgi:ankyrin repeat protein
MACRRRGPRQRDRNRAARNGLNPPGVASEREAFEAVHDGDAARLRALLEEDPGLAAAGGQDGVSLLLTAQYAMSEELVAAVLAAEPELDVHEAAAVGDSDRLRDLLDGRPELARAFAVDGFAPLHLAAFFRRPDAARVLLDRGADANAQALNKTRVAPLHSAAASADRDSARLLLAAGADPNARQEGGFVPLHSAAAAGDRELVELLLESGADRAAETDDGRTPAALARERGHGELAEQLAT